MEQETKGIFQNIGREPGLAFGRGRLRGKLRRSGGRPVKGACKVEPIPYIYDELGAMAFTYSSNGNVQPFTQVSGDKVAASVRSAMWGGDFQKGDLLFGRALGRVLAHELVHMLTRSGRHDSEGVQRPAVSSRELISGSLPLSPADVDRLRELQKPRD